MLKTLGNVIHTVTYSKPLKELGVAKDIIVYVLLTAMHAMQTNIATALKSSSGALVYAKDMFLNITLITDWQTVVARKRKLVDKYLITENPKRSSCYCYY